MKKQQEKHEKDYSVEKYNCWAHMIHVGKHTSYDMPPDLPYFRGTKKPRTQESDSSSSSQPSPPTVITFPSKRVNLRGECIDQLDKWHSLLEKGAISQSQYDEMQKAIMKDIFSQFLTIKLIVYTPKTFIKLISVYVTSNLISSHFVLSKKRNVLVKCFEKLIV